MQIYWPTRHYRHNRFLYNLYSICVLILQCQYCCSQFRRPNNECVGFAESVSSFFKFINIKIPCTKKEIRVQTLNLLNEPQNLAKTKPPKLLKIPNKGITNLGERKLKNNKLKLRENKLKYAKNVHVSFPVSRLEFFVVIG